MQKFTLLVVGLILFSSAINAQVYEAASGNVGIGIAEPSAKLHVNGSQILETSGYTANSRTLTIKNSGTSQVNFGSYAGAWRSSIQLQNNIANMGLFLAPPETDYGYSIIRSINGGLKIDVGGTYSNVGANALTIENNGNVGIGSADPRAFFDVNKYVSNGQLGTVLGRLPEGNTSGEGTFLGVRGFETQWGNYSGKSFSLEHGFYGYVNSSINFFRGSGMTGGFITINTLNNTEQMRITHEGNVGIGTTAPGPYKLAVEGTIGARRVKVTQVSPWADYVFEPTYKLPTLKEVEAFINKHKHLPDVPSAKEVEQNGLDLGDNQAILLKKIEELTLYVIQQQKEIERLNRKIDQLDSKHH